MEGFVAGILWVVVIAFILLTLVALLVAILAPKSDKARVIWVYVVLASFVFLPTWLSYRLSQDSSHQNAQNAQDAKTFSDACANAAVNIQAVNVGRGYAVHSEYLQMGLSRTIDARDIIRHLLERKLSFLEINYDYGDWQGQGFGKLSRRDYGFPYVRLTLQRQGHPSCVAFEDWIAKEPGNLPWIRMLGLSNSYCIGTEGVVTPQSRFAVLLKETSGVMGYKQGQGMWKYHFELHDSTNNAAAGSLISYVGRNHAHGRILCNKQADLAQFKAAIAYSPDSRYLRISETINDHPGTFPLPVSAEQHDFDSWRKAKYRVDADPLKTPWVSSDGNVWIENYSSRTDHGYGSRLVILDGNHARKILIKNPEEDVRSSPRISGLAVDSKTIKVFAYTGRSTIPTTILEYSRTGTPRRILTVSTQQIESLRPPKEAATATPIPRAIAK